jgi:subtilase family serine protease
MGLWWLSILRKLEGIVQKRKGIALAASAGVLVAGLIAAAASQAPAATRPNVQGAQQAHAKVLRPGVIEMGTGVTGLPNTATCKADFGVSCLWPSQLQTAYNEGPLFSRGIKGKGETIAIVDAFGSPTIKSDLAVFDKQFNLPAPPSLKVIAPAGAIPKWDPNNADMAGWGAETTLDVEYAHAIAPLANIVLVETPVSETEGVQGFPQIVAAESYVIKNLKVGVISQSFGATEQTFPGGVAQIKQLGLRNAYILAHNSKYNVTVLAASGDAGATDFQADGLDYYTSPVTSWPASDPDVTAVGGTQIRQGGNHTYYSVAWNDTYNPNVVGPVAAPAASGGGLSVFFSRPSFQNGAGVQSVVGTQRGVPDISMSAACNGGVWVYWSFPLTGVPAAWHLICGTSEATPEFAGIVALADEVAGHPLGLINSKLYALAVAKAPGIVPVLRGNNTVTFTQGNPAVTTTVSVPGGTAQAPYSLVTGVGTVNAAALVYELAGKPVP